MDAVTDILSIDEAAFELKLPTPLRDDLSNHLTRQVNQAVSVVEQNTRRILIDKEVVHEVERPAIDEWPVRLAQADIQAITSIAYWDEAEDERVPPDGAVADAANQRLVPIIPESPRAGHYLYAPSDGGWPDTERLVVHMDCGMTAESVDLNTARRAVILALFDIYGGYPKQSGAFHALCNRIRSLQYTERFETYNFRPPISFDYRYRYLQCLSHCPSPCSSPVPTPSAPTARWSGPSL